MLEDVARFVRLHGLLHPHDRVLVAVSGGVDSMVLLHILCALQTEFQVGLCVAHLDHSLRASSAEDARFVAATAQRLDLHYVGGAKDVAAFARETRQSLEAAAREVRKSFLQTAALAEGCNVIALGHHKNDQAETFLLNLIRGAGPQGLVGMRPRNGPYIRPLLACLRQDIEAYAARANVTFREDHSNRDVRFTRNRIRWQVLPRLEQLNPNLIETLGNTQAVLAYDHQYIQAQTQEALQRLVRKRTEQYVRLDRRQFCGLPRALCAAVVRLVFGQLVGNRRRLSFAHIQAALEHSKSGRFGTAVELPQGLTLRVTQEALHFHRQVDTVPPAPCTLSVPGVTQWLGWSFSAKVDQRLPIDLNRCKEGRLSVQLDWGTIEPPLVVRSRRAGDRIDPLGLAGRKKIQDIFVDAKVPRDLRDGVPLIADQKGIVWVVGHCQSDRTKLTQSTQQVLTLDAKCA